MFVGRSEELKQLNAQLNIKKRTAVLVYGKRRVGKSTLISEAAKSYKGTVIEHLCAQTTFQGNLSLLARSISQALDLPELSFANLFDIFDFLKAQKRDILLVLDEYQYFKQSLRAKELDSYMQAVIDSLPANVKLVLCGSYISLMKELLEEDNPLFGRFSAIIHVQDFDYYDAARFFPELSPYDRIAFYAVFGGSPYVLSSLDASASLRENIEELLLSPMALLRVHIENVMLREVQKAFDVRILEALGNGRKRYSEILTSLGEKNDGLLDKQLKSLVDMEVIRKNSPINRRNDRRRQFYEIEDNLMRVFFSYIFGNGAQIARLGGSAFYESAIEPSITQFVSRRLEEVAQQFFMREARAGKLKGISDIGSMWYDDPVTQTNGEFDCVLQFGENYDVFECKFYAKPMTLSECKKEEAQARAIPGTNVRDVGFVCPAGFEFETGEYRLIDGETLFK